MSTAGHYITLALPHIKEVIDRYIEAEEKTITRAYRDGSMTQDMARDALVVKLTAKSILTKLEKATIVPVAEHRGEV